MPGKPFNGVINLDVRDSRRGLGCVHCRSRRRTDAPNVLVVLYDDTGCAAWSPYGGRIEMPTLQRLADERPDLRAVAHHRALLADALDLPDRAATTTQNGFASISETSTGFPGYSSHIPPENATMAHVLRDAGWQHVLGRQEPQHPGRRVDDGRRPRRTGRSGMGYDRFYGFIGGETNNWYPTSPRTTTTSTSRTCPRTATTSPRTWPTRRCASSATPSSPSPTSRGTCGSARAPTTRRTTRRRSTSTSTRASSTTATRPTASGCCRG